MMSRLCLIKFIPTKILHLAKNYMVGAQVPLHPALELIAVYNGFHHMNKLRLEELMAHIDAEIHHHSKRQSLLDLMVVDKVQIPCVGHSGKMWSFTY